MSTANENDIVDAPSHIPGLTRSCFSKDGTQLFTAGSDGRLLALPLSGGVVDTTQEPVLIEGDVYGEYTCLDCGDGRLITGATDGKVRSFLQDGKDYSFDGFVTSTTGVPVRWLAISPSGDKVAVCSDELVVKICDLNDTRATPLFIIVSKPVRSASWHPTNGTLAIVSTDGKIFIYEIAGSTSSCLKEIEGLVAPSKTESEPVPVVTWHPSGEYFAIGTRSQELAIIDGSSYLKQATFATDGHDSEIGMIAWSPNGLYLTSSGKDEQIIVWDTQSRQPVKRYRARKGLVTSLQFCPTENAIAYTTITGGVFSWRDPIPADRPHPVRASTKSRGEGARVKVPGDDLFGEDEDGEDLLDDDGWIEDDGDGNYKEREASVGYGGRQEVVSITKAQGAFQPGSTSFKSKKRFLAFNMIGVIEATDQEDYQVINVEVHDTASRAGYHFQDHHRYNVAALGERGVVCASRSEGERESAIHYRAFNDKNDWQVELPAGEEVILVASGGSLAESDLDEEYAVASVAVATNKGYIRFFTQTGIQRYIWRMGEEVVSMVAGKDLLFIAHREGGTSLDGCQNLRYTLIDMNTFELVQDGRLPLPKKTTLSWVGFAEFGAPLMYDSDGMLSVLDRYGRPGQARWVPLLDSNTLARKQGKQESYWPVGVTDKQFMCVILKGTEREPSFPRPIVFELDMHMPLLRLNETPGQLEEKNVRGSLLLGFLQDSLEKNPDLSYDIAQRETELDKELLLLLQNACKAGPSKNARALEIVRLMHATASIEAAGKVAAFYSFNNLREKIEVVKEVVEERKQEQARRTRRDRQHQHATAIKSAGRSVADYRETSFAPRGASSRRTAVASVMRETSPPRHGTGDTYVAETPEVESLPARVSPSAEGKRKRDAMAWDPPDEVMMSPEEMQEPPSKRPAAEPQQPAKTGSKNPFARKPAAASNPFAKPIDGRSNSTLKSTSFFERVDDIENQSAAKKSNKGKEKQTTLFGMGAKGPAKTRKKSVLDETTEQAALVAATSEDNTPADTTGRLAVDQDDEDLEETQADLAETKAIRALPRAEDELGEDEWSASEAGDAEGEEIEGDDEMPGDIAVEA